MSDYPYREPYEEGFSDGADEAKERIAELEAELTKKDTMLQEAREKWSTRAFERDKYHQQLAALKEKARAAVNAPYEDILDMGLAQALRELKETINDPE